MPVLSVLCELINPDRPCEVHNEALIWQRGEGRIVMQASGSKGRVLSEPILLFFNCGKTQNTVFTILTIFKRAVQWRLYIHIVLPLPPM